MNTGVVATPRVEERDLIDDNQRRYLRSNRAAQIFHVDLQRVFFLFTIRISNTRATKKSYSNYYTGVFERYAKVKRVRRKAFDQRRNRHLAAISFLKERHSVASSLARNRQARRKQEDGRGGRWLQHTSPRRGWGQAGEHRPTLPSDQPNDRLFADRPRKRERKEIAH